jgi:predicted nucleic acid-binding protein
MSLYTADAVSLLRYLVDQLPSTAGELFTRAEQGIDSIETPDVALAEVLTAVGNTREVGGITLEMTPQQALQELVTNGPIEVASIGEHELTVFASELDRYSMHDGLIAATHRVRGTDAIISKDPVFENTGIETVWD